MDSRSSRAPVRRVSRALGAALTGPAAFFASGLIDVISGLRLALIYLWRTTMRSR